MKVYGFWTISPPLTGSLVATPWVIDACSRVVSPQKAPSSAYSDTPQIALYVVVVNGGGGLSGSRKAGAGEEVEQKVCVGTQGGGEEKKMPTGGARIVILTLTELYGYQRGCPELHLV